MTPPSKPQTWTHSDDCRHLYDDETDIRLDIDGNWASDAERKEFANRLCDLLNGVPVAVQPPRKELPGGRWTCPYCGKSVLRGMMGRHPDDCHLPNEQTP